MKKLRYIVQRGEEPGVVLTPHRYKEGYYVVSMTRFEQDQFAVQNEAELLDYVQRGYGVRMSNPNTEKHKAPSLISAGEIEIRDVD